MPEHGRARSVERLLRHTLAGGSTRSAPGVCVDGETLAAWSAGALQTKEASTVEQHLADCARCQAILAALVRSTPPEPAAVPLWRRWRLQWLVPLATAATAAAIWLAIPDSPILLQPLPESQRAARSEPEAALPAQVPQAFEGRARAGDGNAPPKERADESAARATASQAPAPPVPAEAVGRLAQTETSRRVADEAEAEFRPDRTPRERQAEADSRNEALKTARALSATAPPATFEVSAPGSTARWRITTGGRVDWSKSGGPEWEAASISPADALTAGAASSPSVCWLVGRAGAVYVTTDGSRFARVSFPEEVDLVAVTAPDDRTATVTSGDGRSWTTTDQGRTWSPN